MGSLEGHVLPGVLFIFYGLVWIILSFWLYLTTPGKSQPSSKSKGNASNTTYLDFKRDVKLGRVSYIPQPFFSKIPFESIIKIFLSFLGIIAEAFFDKKDGKLVFSVMAIYSSGGDGSFTNLSKVHHITMYSSFLLSGLVDIIGLVVRLPRNATKIFFSLAFATEGILFWFHSHDKDHLNVAVHSLLICAIASCMVLSILRMLQPTNVLINSFLGVSILLQGTWFIQVGTILYGKHHWDMGDEMEDEHKTSQNIMLATAAFTWHVTGNAFGSVLVYIVMLACIKGSVKYKNARKRKRGGVGFTWPTTLLPLVHKNEVVVRDDGDEEREQLMNNNTETKDTIL